jgi:microcystin-dependent protein
VSDPFLGEIRIVSWSFAPRGWAFCNGQLLPVSQNAPLFTLLGKTYGGDGQTTFSLPNLQGLTPIHMGNGFTIGQQGGEQAHTLTIDEAATHTHSAAGSSTSGDSPVPAGNYLGGADNFYAPLQNATTLPSATIASTGGSQPHNNMQPYLVLSFVIALQGIFPPQT